MTTSLREVRRRGPQRDPKGKVALFVESTREPVRGPHVVVECSDCRRSTHVSYVDLVRALLPFNVWLPPVGVRFNRRLRCPACNRRTWTRVHWLV